MLLEFEQFILFFLLIIFSHFGYYDEYENVLDMKNQSFYKHDLFGLRTLNEKGRLAAFGVSGVTHYEWHRNITVIDKYIIPWLT